MQRTLHGQEQLQQVHTQLLLRCCQWQQLLLLILVIVVVVIIVLLCNWLQLPLSQRWRAGAHVPEVCGGAGQSEDQIKAGSAAASAAAAQAEA